MHPQQDVHQLGRDIHQASSAATTVDKPRRTNPNDQSQSFFFPTVHHLSALQREGLRIWNCQTNRVFTSRPFLLEAADGPEL
ncbi:hypothetical protein B0H13DRAFT_1599001, partial [Mycena leptocephala]